MNIQCEFCLLSVSSHTSCHQKNLQTFSREETVVLATPSYSEKHWKKEKGNKKNNQHSAPIWFSHIHKSVKSFSLQPKSHCYLFTTIHPPVLFIFLTDCLGAQGLPIFSNQLSGRHHRVCSSVVLLTTTRLFDVRRGCESQQDFDEPKRLP